MRATEKQKGDNYWSFCQWRNLIVVAFFSYFVQRNGMAQKVRLVRIAQGYPSYKFAALVGVHPNWWRETEMGTSKPSQGVMLRASEILKRLV
jgi:hypothetical protein